MNKPPVATQTVFITGCSSGIGAATAEWFLNNGWRVWASARKPEDLKRLKAQGFTPVPLDLTDSASIQAAARQVLEETDGRLGALVNNAGYCQAGALEDLSRDVLRRQFEANVFGLHELTRAILPAFKKQQCGRIINVSSVFGRIATPMVGAYCASKFAVEALSAAWRIELHDTGIGVCIITPGAIITEFRRNAAQALEQGVSLQASSFGSAYEKEIERRKRQRKKRDFFTRPPEEVARKIFHAATSPRPKRRYLVTPSAYLVEAAIRLLPAACLDRLLAKRIPKRSAATEPTA